MTQEIQGEHRPNITVVIPHFNDWERLATCLAAIRAGDLPQAVYEVVIVDNGSEHPPPRSVTEAANVTVLHEPVPGSYAARNRGLDAATTELLAFTDSDCLPSRTWLSSAVELLRSRSELAFATGPIRLFPLNEDRPNAVELYDMLFGLRQEDNLRQHHFAATANMVTRRSTFAAFGRFDASLKSGGDHEWGNRVTDGGGHSVFLPALEVRHPARATLADLLRQARRHAGGRMDVRKDRPFRPTTLHFWRILLRVILPPFRMYRQAWRRGRETGLGPVQTLRVFGVATAVHYSRLTGMASAKFLKNSERN